jgi:hypothetical protein
MGKTASQSVKDLTSPGFNLIKHTLAAPMKVLMFTHLLFALKSINHQALATSPELITPLFNWSCQMPLLKEPRLPRSVSMPPTTTFSEL